MKLSALISFVFCAGILISIGAPMAHAAKPVLTITANSATTTWGDAFPELTLSYSGFIDSDEDGLLDTSDNLEMIIVASTSATVESPAGVYAITPDLDSGGGDFNPSSVLTDSVYDIVTVNGTLTILKADQTITDLEPFLSAPFASKNFGDADFELSAITDSGLAATFAGTGACSVEGTTVHILSGTLCTITVSQAGDQNWNAATPVVQTFSVVGSPVEEEVVEPAPRRSGGGGGSRVRNSGGRVLGDSTYYFANDLYIWDEGQDVTELQKILIAEGLYLDVTTPTGFFGRKTQAAVRVYQSQRGVPSTGNVGPLTRAFLNIGRTDVSTDPSRQIDIMYELLLKLQAQLAK